MIEATLSFLTGSWAVISAFLVAYLAGRVWYLKKELSDCRNHNEELYKEKLKQAEQIVSLRKKTFSQETILATTIETLKRHYKDITGD